MGSSPQAVPCISYIQPGLIPVQYKMDYKGNLKKMIRKWCLINMILFMLVENVESSFRITTCNYLNASSHSPAVYSVLLHAFFHSRIYIYIFLGETSMTVVETYAYMYNSHTLSTRCINIYQQNHMHSYGNITIKHIHCNLCSHRFHEILQEWFMK